MTFKQNRYTSNGTIFFNEDKGWCVQIEHVLLASGHSYKVVKWATWYNNRYICSLQETCEHVDMLNWKIASDSDIVLYCTQEIINNINKIKSLIEFGYRGSHNTSETLLAELEWRMF